MVRRIFNNKKGLMDDLFDLVFTVTALFFILFFVSFVLTANVSAKQDSADDSFLIVENKQILMNHLYAPLEHNGTTILLKDALLLILNNQENEYLNPVIKSYLETTDFTGAISVYTVPGDDDVPHSFLLGISPSLFSFEKPVSIILYNPSNDDLQYVEVEFHKKDE